jgi:hypothetical protein
MTGSDPELTSALRTTTAAIHPTAGIARVVVFITDAADRPVRGRLARGDAPEPTSDHTAVRANKKPFCGLVALPICCEVALLELRRLMVLAVLYRAFQLPPC